MSVVEEVLAEVERLQLHNRLLLAEVVHHQHVGSWSHAAVLVRSITANQHRIKTLHDSCTS